MNDITINYGQTKLILTKSDRLVGLKLARGAAIQSVAATAPARMSATGREQAGFEIVDLGQAEQGVEKGLDLLREHPKVDVGTHVFLTSDDGVPFVPTGHLYIEFRPDAPLEDCQALVDQHHLQLVEARGERELVAAVTPESGNPVKTAAALQQSPLIAVAEPELATPGKLHAFVTPDDPRLRDQWHLRNTGFHRGTSLGFKTGADARVIAAWEEAQNIGTPATIVAVIDDGFDLGHPDLAGTWKIVAPMDFTRGTPNPRPDLLGHDWHGTACAGVAVGNANGSGVVGAAPACRLMPVRWGVDLSDGEIEAWFDHVRTHGAWVVSCSWGALAWFFPLSTRAHRAIARCAQEGRGGLGTVICFAAGNENRDVNSPQTGSVNGFAIHPDVLAVAASTSRDDRSHYSNYGREIFICAPSSGNGGWGITTTDVRGRYWENGVRVSAGYSPGSYTNDFGGTSSAAPLVAGVCGLLLSVKPQLTAAQVKDILRTTARKIGGGSYGADGHSRQFGYGCIDAEAAIQSLSANFAIAPLWGEQGHHSTNRVAIKAIPDKKLRDYYTLNADYIEQHSMDADHAKKTNPAERPRHYLDMDLYGDYPFSELPEDYDDAVKKFGKSMVTKNGLLPWQLEITFKALVDSFKAKKWPDVLRHSAWLGHYCGDAHVPFHSTKNHDGQLTGQKGLHSYFESRLLKTHIHPQDIKPNDGRQYQTAPHLLAFRWLRESFTYVQPLLDADAANGGKAGRRNLAGFAQAARPIAISRLTKGAARLAGLWFTAWIEGGKPAPPAN